MSFVCVLWWFYDGKECVLKATQPFDCYQRRKGWNKVEFRNREERVRVKTGLQAFFTQIFDTFLYGQSDTYELPSRFNFGSFGSFQTSFLNVGFDV